MSENLKPRQRVIHCADEENPVTERTCYVTCYDDVTSALLDADEARWHARMYGGFGFWRLKPLNPEQRND